MKVTLTKKQKDLFKKLYNDWAVVVDDLYGDLYLIKDDDRLDMDRVSGFIEQISVYRDVSDKALLSLTELAQAIEEESVENSLTIDGLTASALGNADDYVQGYRKYTKYETLNIKCMNRVDVRVCRNPEDLSDSTLEKCFEVRVLFVDEKGKCWKFMTWADNDGHPLLATQDKTSELIDTTAFSNDYLAKLSVQCRLVNLD